MSILDTFYILFKSDTKELKKGVEEAEKTTKHLDESLKNLGKNSQNVGHSFLSLAESFTGLVAGAFSAATVISGVSTALEYGQKLSQTSKLLRVNITDLQAWSGAVELAGGTAEGFQSSLTSLASHFNSSTEVALKSLPRLAGLFSRLNQTQALNYGKSLGLDENTILLLQKGRREVEAIINKEKERKLLSKENIELFGKYRLATAANTQAQQDFYNVIALQILPVLTKLQEYSTKAFGYLADHGDLVEGAILGIASAIGVLAARLAFIHPELVLLAAALTAIPVVYEDIKQTINGNPNTFTNKIKQRFTPHSRSTTSAEREESKQKIIDAFHIPEGLQKFFGHTPLHPGGVGGGTKIQNNITNIGDVTIQASPGDAQGILDQFTNYVQTVRTQQAQSNNYFDDGVLA